MEIIYILLPLLGALPLVITIIKMINGQHIIKNGTKTEAKVVQINSFGMSYRNRIDTLILQYPVEGRKEIHQGRATAAPGQYKVGDTLAIIYLNENPNKMTVKGAKVYIPFLVFTGLLFLFVVFATFKIAEMVPE